jgi:hypothetical protein
VVALSAIVAACSGKFATTGNEQLSNDGGGETGGAMSGAGGAKATGGSRSSGGSRTSGGSTGVGGGTGVGGVTGGGGVVSTDASAGGGTGGVVSTGGVVGTGGVRPTGGAPGSGGTNATGGVVNSGGALPTGGAPVTGGFAGAGGLPQFCIPGSLKCDAHQRCDNTGQWQQYICQPLVATQVTNIDPANLPGFNLGSSFFRCKSLVVCGVSQSCHYSAQVGSGNLGSVQSSEDTFYPGVVLSDGQAVKIQIMTGAASQCGDPPITIAAGDSIAVTLATGRTVVITFPSFTGVQLLLYVREDGATFYDDSLLQRAG